MKKEINWSLPEPKTATTKQALNENETKALKIVTEESEMAYTADEITQDVSISLGISLNAAKGYLGQLTMKGYIQKCSYYEGLGRNRTKVTQFEILP